MSAEQARSARTEGKPLLSVENLRTSFYTDKEVTRTVDSISFDIFRGETVDIVGEFESSKSVTVCSIMWLVEKPGRIENGRIIYGDKDLLDKSAKQMRSIRGGNIAIVLQDPLTNLDPVYTVGNQVKEAFRLHRGLSGPKATKETIELLEAVGIPDAHRHVREHPHQFSGGMRQYTVIAMALTCDPGLLVCDEPITALDVTIRTWILKLLGELQGERDLGIMLITHDMDVVAGMADRVDVVYAGEIVESAPVVGLLESPKHPYTQGPLNSIPGQGPDEDERLATIEGDVPTPSEGPTYCRFVPRCPRAFTECDTVHPKPVEVGNGTGRHRVSYLLYPDDLPTKEAVAVHRKGRQRGGDTR